MQYGICLPLSGFKGEIEPVIEFAHIAEEEGWDGIFIEDYIVYWGAQGVTYDPWQALAAIAVRTQRVKLGFSVIPLPSRLPWQLARQAITLDRLSHGRLILGFGLGDEHDIHFGEVSNPKQRGEMLDEGLELLAGLTARGNSGTGRGNSGMSGQPFSYEGKHYRTNGAVTFEPGPLQPRIPIWLGGWWPRKRPALRAARWDGFIPAKLPDEHGDGDIKPDDIRAIKRFIDEHRTSSDPFDLCTGGNTPGEDRSRAHEQIEPLIEAGATWWSEFVLESAEPERMLQRIRQGPPR